MPEETSSEDVSDDETSEVPAGMLCEAVEALPSTEVAAELSADAGDE